MKCDVLIVGAGPVGLMLGCELAKRGVSHRLVETKTQRERFCKALGVAPRTMEIFDHLGILDEALRRGFYFTATSVVAAGEIVQRTEMKDIPDMDYGSFGMAQPDTEDILEDYYTRFGHSIERGKTLSTLTQDEEKVTAVFEDGETVTARYVVGCDGAHSSVRKQLGTGFEGERFERTFLLGDVHIDWDSTHTDCWQMLIFEDGEMRNNVTLIANPTGPGRYRVSTSIDPDADCPEHPPLELLQEIIAPALPEGTTVSDMRWSSRYNISHRIATDYRTGRVFLAGDAAHIHPPIGGLGMNTGLQDAYNLGWKLAAACQGKLPDSILDTYHSERRPVGAKVVEVTAARMARALRGESARGSSEPPFFDTQLNIRYEPGALVGGEAPASGLPRPGDRLPSVLGLRRPHIAGDARLPEVFRDGRFQLFTRDADHHAFHLAAQQALGDQVRCWSILDESPAEAEGHFVDSGKNWSKTIGSGAVLVRPDNVIGWRGSDSTDLKTWLTRVAGIAVAAT